MYVRTVGWNGVEWMSSAPTRSDAVKLVPLVQAKISHLVGSFSGSMGKRVVVFDGDACLVHLREHGVDQFVAVDSVRFVAVLGFATSTESPTNCR